MPTYVVPQIDHEPVEIRLILPTENYAVQTSHFVARTTSTPQAKAFLRRNFRQITGEFQKKGLLPKELGATILTFDIIHTEKARAELTPITFHPITAPERKTKPNTIYFDTQSLATLKDPENYKVELIGRHHYKVVSKSGDFLVDLEQCNGLGACSCPDFELHKSPHARKAKKTSGNQRSYKHEDCTHLRHVKFLLGRPFGNVTMIPENQMTDAGHDPFPP
jgi:hypothetical protein